jgi:transcriptional regulator with XRE-family HTH domain
MTTTTRLSLAALRQAAGYTLEEFGVLVGLSAPMLSLAERGERRLSPESRVRAMRALGLSARVARLVPELAPEGDVR